MAPESKKRSKTVLDGVHPSRHKTSCITRLTERDN